MRLHQARTLALIHRFYIFEICWFLTLRITADAEGCRDGGPLLLLHCEGGFIGDALSASEEGTHSHRTLVLVNSFLALAQPIGLLTCANTTRLEGAMMDFGDCIHSLTSATLYRTSSPCLQCSPGLLSEYCFLPVFILLHCPKTTTEI